MDYDEFKTAFLAALRASRLPPLGLAPRESLDLVSTDRTLSIGVEALDRDIGKPFHLSATISYRWSALQTARTTSCEGDFLEQVFGRAARKRKTERPWLRIDIQLRAGLEWGKGIPMPSPTTWATWSREALMRLETVERVVSEDVVRETRDGDHAILAWQSDPEARVACRQRGQLYLEEIQVNAFQGIDLPRKRNDELDKPDKGPQEQLALMFARVRSALHAWGEVTDHLHPSRAPAS